MKTGRVFAPLVVLVASALFATLAHAGTYNVFTCSIDGAFYPNRAWTSASNPVGNPAFQTDTSCPKAGDALSASLAPNTVYGTGTFAALPFNAPSGTKITDYELALKHYWYAPALPNYVIERTYTLASFGDVPVLGYGSLPAVRPGRARGRATLVRVPRQQLVWGGGDAGDDGVARHFAARDGRSGRAEHQALGRLLDR